MGLTHLRGYLRRMAWPQGVIPEAWRTPAPTPPWRVRMARRLYRAALFSPSAWLHRRAWPLYDCDDCIGMRDHGCYCAAIGSATPGGMIDPTRYGWRLAHGLIFIWTSPFWDEVERTWTDADVLPYPGA